MQSKWSYIALLSIFLLIGGVFIISPFVAANALSTAVRDNQTEHWQQQIQADYFKEYSRTLLKGMLRVKLAVESNNPAGVKAAMQDYQAAKDLVILQADKIVEPKGFAHLLCGEVSRYPEVPEQNKVGCWALDGDVRWQSLTHAVVSYRNPEQGWESHLQLERTGLFSWQAVSIELPIDAMLEQFERQFLAIE